MPDYTQILYQNGVYWLLPPNFGLYLPVEIIYTHLHMYKNGFVITINHYHS